MSQVVTNDTKTDSLEGKAYTTVRGQTEAYPWGAGVARVRRGQPQKYFPLFCLLPFLILSAILFSYHTTLMSCLDSREVLSSRIASISDKFFLFPKEPGK